MTERVGIRELRQNLSRYLDQVKAGQDFVVTDRGRVAARLVPARASDDAYADLSVRFGATVPVQPLEEIAARLPPRRTEAGKTDAYLAEGRSERTG